MASGAGVVLSFELLKEPEQGLIEQRRLLKIGQALLGAFAQCRQSIKGQDGWIVREGLNAYGAIFDSEN